MLSIFSRLFKRKVEGIKVKVERENVTAQLPKYAASNRRGGNTGADLYSVENVTVYAHTVKMISTGLRVEVPPGVDMQIRSRSGLASKGIFVINSPGTIDPDYRGEVKILLYNTSDIPYEVAIGDKIAQAVFAKFLVAEFVEENVSFTTIRGEGGFNSTGK